jgi:nicotinamide riboside kinase
MQREIFKIVLTGPESTGKTSLAIALATALQTVWVPEFARPYVSFLGRTYRQEDLRYVTAGQRAWEAWYAPRAGQFLVCDTDWTVVRIWNAYKFGVHWPVQMKENDVHYFLCAPDFDWIPDPLREHPAERDVVYGLYVDLLNETGASYTVLRGSLEDRLQAALTVIRNF